MDITWIGHAAFLLRSGNSSLLMDPFPETIGVRVPPSMVRPRLITVSNSHPNHSATKIAPESPAVLTGPGEYEIAGLRIRGLRTRLNPDSEAGGGEWNTIFVTEVEGISVCHLGALASPMTARQVADLSSPHVLLIPVGGHGALSPLEAAEVVNAIEPRIAIPMMYAHSGNHLPLEPLASFTRELGIKQPEPQARLTVTRATLPTEMQIMPLAPAATLL